MSAATVSFQSTCRTAALVLILLTPMISSAGEHKPWQATIARIKTELGASTRLLREAQARLLERASARQTVLVARLSVSQPELRDTGYGILPNIRVESSAASPARNEIRYSLATLDTRSTDGLAEVKRLASDARLRDTDLEVLTVRFERARDELSNIDSHLRYHAYWQQALADDPEPFAWRNETLTLLRQRRLLDRTDSAGSTTDAAALQTRIDERLSAFQQVNGLQMWGDADAGHRIELVLHTDIADPLFLDSVREAVENHWNRSAAMLAAKLRVELSLIYVPAERLYPEGAPAPNAAIDLPDHVSRFPAGALVLTTGALSTHAWTGRSVLLGPEPLTLRTIAHELGHLLGFNDAYVRGFEGDPEGPFGAVLVEWRGNSHDLMGNPAAGAVTPGMVRKLFGAYASEPVACPCDAPSPAPE